MSTVQLSTTSDLQTAHGIPAGISLERYIDPDTHAETMTINMGPQHPSTHGVLRLVLELDGETVVKCTPHIGYLHTGIEKTMENLSYYKALVLTDREDYLSNLCNNLAYSMAVEKLMAVEIPPKGQWMRVLLNELERIASHMLWLGTHALDLGAMSMFFYTWQDRDRILEIKEHLSGVRTKTSWICPGGLRGDAPTGWMKRVKAFLDYFPERIELFETLLTNNPIWIERTRGVGVISAEDADRVRDGRPEPARLGRELGPAQVEPVFELREVRLQRPGGPVRRRLRPVPLPDGGAAPESSHLPAGVRRDARGAGPHLGPQDRAAAARRTGHVDGGADPPLQAVHRGLPPAGRRGDRGGRRAARREGLLYRSPTARTSRTGPRSRGRAFSTCRRCPGWWKAAWSPTRSR
jgi:hypothetical protein